MDNLCTNLTYMTVKRDRFKEKKNVTKHVITLYKFVSYMYARQIKINYCHTSHWKKGGLDCLQRNV
jgi:hypothetical protein